MRVSQYMMPPLNLYELSQERTILREIGTKKKMKPLHLKQIMKVSQNSKQKNFKNRMERKKIKKKNQMN